MAAWRRWQALAQRARGGSVGAPRQPRTANPGKRIPAGSRQRRGEPLRSVPVQDQVTATGAHLAPAPQRCPRQVAAPLVIVVVAVVVPLFTGRDSGDETHNTFSLALPIYRGFPGGCNQVPYIRMALYRVRGAAGCDRTGRLPRCAPAAAFPVGSNSCATER